MSKIKYFPEDMDVQNKTVILIPKNNYTNFVEKK